MQVAFGKTTPEFIKRPVLHVCPWHGTLRAHLSLGKGHFLRQKPASKPSTAYVKMQGGMEPPYFILHIWNTNERNCYYFNKMFPLDPSATLELQ